MRIMNGGQLYFNIGKEVLRYLFGFFTNNGKVGQCGRRNWSKTIERGLYFWCRCRHCAWTVERFSLAQMQGPCLFPNAAGFLEDIHLLKVAGTSRFIGCWTWLSWRFKSDENLVILEWIGKYIRSP